jgi:hypothetical protein
MSFEDRANPPHRLSEKRAMACLMVAMIAKSFDFDCGRQASAAGVGCGFVAVVEKHGLLKDLKNNATVMSAPDSFDGIVRLVILWICVS